MVIKKYESNKPQNTDLNKRLAAYARQGRSYCKLHKGKSPASGNLLKGTLAAVIPLAAAGALHAQTGCEGAVGPITIPFVTGSTQSTSVAVGGGSIVFYAFFSSSSGEFDRHLSVGGGGFGVVLTSSYNVVNFGGNVTRSNTMFNTTTGGYLCLQTSPPGSAVVNTTGDFCAGATGFFAIKETSATPDVPGWMQIQILEFSATQVRFNILERGIEHPNNPNTNLAQVGNCSDNPEGINPAALPVEMTHFRISPEDKHIHLDWATASELNNEGFEVQRSTDGRSFAKIGWVNGKGTTNKEQTYRFLDDEVQPNTKYYYRLQQMDSNGTSDFSPVRSAMVVDANVMQVSELFPNPVGKGRGLARFRLQAPAGGEAVIQLFDARGALVKELNREYTAGQNTLAVPIRHLPAGQYFVKMQLGKEVFYRKLAVN